MRKKNYTFIIQLFKKVICLCHEIFFLTSVFDIPASMDQLNTMMRVELLTDFDGLGLSMHDLYVQAISLPDEVQQKIDTKSGIN